MPNAVKITHPSKSSRSRSRSRSLHARSGSPLIISATIQRSSKLAREGDTYLFFLNHYIHHARNLFFCTSPTSLFATVEWCCEARRNVPLECGHAPTRVCCRVEGHHEAGVNARRTNLSASSLFCLYALLIDDEPLCDRRVVLRSATYLTSGMSTLQLCCRVEGHHKAGANARRTTHKPTCVMCDLKIGTSGAFNKLKEYRRRSGQHRVCALSWVQTLLS